MTDARVTIDAIALRVPNLSPDEARLLGEEVAIAVGTELARLLDDDPAAVDLGGLDLRMTVRDGTSREQLARAITARIVDGLRPALAAGRLAR